MKGGTIIKMTLKSENSMSAFRSEGYFRFIASNIILLICFKRYNVCQPFVRDFQNKLTRISINLSIRTLVYIIYKWINENVG